MFPEELANAVERANSDADIHVIVLAGAGRAFCAGYDLTYYAQASGGDGNNVTQEMALGSDEGLCLHVAQYRIVSCRCGIHTVPSWPKSMGFAVAGGSDICPVRRHDRDGRRCANRIHAFPCLGLPRRRRCGFTGSAPNRPSACFSPETGSAAKEAERIGLVSKSVPAAELDEEVERLAERMSTVPVNQLMMQKMVINQAVEAMGLKNTQRLATVFDGITRHSPRRPQLQASCRRNRLEKCREGTRSWYV